MGLVRAVVLLTLVGLWLAPVSARGTLDADEVQLKRALEARSGEMLETLRLWVATNSGSFNHDGLERFSKMLAEPLSRLGFALEIVPGKALGLPGRPTKTGPLVIARRPAPSGVEGAPRFLLVGHYDTVFERASPFQRLRLDPDDPGRAIGPGVADMKGGLVVMLFALQALAESGDLDRAGWTVIFNADEEVGSLVSRARIEAEARRADYGFVFEAARPDGAMVRSRRGVGQFRLEVSGVAAHAGQAHAKGRSAIHELALKVVRVEALTDYSRGITFNVGTIEGGTKRNIVPERAYAWVDVRYDDPAQAKEILEGLQLIVQDSAVKGTSTDLWGRLHRPPKPATEPTLELLALHQEVARELGLDPPRPLHAGGGTDGSLMNAVGLPTLDSMGARGGGAHTRREFVVLESLPERAAIAAVLLRRLAHGTVPGSPALRPPEERVD